jgi:hypothetical protein
VTGSLRDNLAAAVTGALQLDRQACREAVDQCTWENATELFQQNLVAARHVGTPGHRLAGSPLDARQGVAPAKLADAGRGSRSKGLPAGA